MLWDIPILSMACVGDSQEDLAVLEQLLDLPPAKFFELGAYQLLMGHFRGVVEVVEAPQVFSWKLLTQNGSTRGLNPKEVPNISGRSRERRRTWGGNLVMRASCRTRWCIQHPRPSMKQIF